MDVGVIGAGAMGRNHARVYAELKGVDDVWVFDQNAEAAKEVAQQTGGLQAGTMGELLRRVDAASLCVPLGDHFAYAREVITAGVHLLIEKPVCRTSYEGEALIGLIPDDLVVGVGHIERFNPILPELRRIVKDPLYAELKRHNPAASEVSGSSVVEDLMIHDIDIILHVFFSGEYTMDSAFTFDVCGALFEFGKTPVYLSASRRASKKVRSICIEMEEMTVEGDFMRQEVYVHRKPENYHVEAQRYVQENIVEKVMVGKVEPLRTELATFLECVKTGHAFPVTPEQAVENIRVCESITRRVHA